MVRDARYVVDGNVVTSQGVSAGIDMALWLIGQLHGRDHARLIRRYIQYEPAPPYLADVFYNLSACYEQMKRKSDAVETLRRGLEAAPQSELLRQRLKQLGG